MTSARPISLLICALGGEGGGVLTEWIVDAARHAGYPVQATSIPGVAQRTGATTYYVEVFPVPQVELGGRRPVFSLNPVPGALDAMVSSELLETVRQIGNGMSSPERTLVITSSGRTLTTQERMQLADGRADSDGLRGVVDTYSRARHVFDMGAVAKDAGTVVSAVMLGALAGSGLFPMTREDYEAVVKESGASAAASLRGFAKAHDLVCNAGLDSSSSVAPGEDGLRVEPAMTVKPSATAEPAMTAETAKPERAVMPDSIRHPSAHADLFPEQVQDMLTLGHARMLEYQGQTYAAVYLQRLQRVLEAERAADPSGEHNFSITREMARWLALWMAFDDIVRVADLKSRASRWQRVKAEVKAGDDDLLRVYDHFKPGAPEFAALLPASLATRVLRWDRARVIKGGSAWALPLKIGTHSVFGMLALRTLASLKWLRVRGSRYANEQAMIDKWLSGVVDGTRRDWRLGHEIALCGRLIKGYGATNERGKENLLHALDHLAHGECAAQSAEAIAAAREASLADDAGKAFDSALVQHGAPPRPVKEQPIRFVRKPKASAAAPG
jgi:indolepyruvate ferredoxin oxidoreductase, beta subunit